jgi:hypothetical protein
LTASSVAALGPFDGVCEPRQCRPVQLTMPRDTVVRLTFPENLVSNDSGASAAKGGDCFGRQSPRPEPSTPCRSDQWTEIKTGSKSPSIRGCAASRSRIQAAETHSQGKKTIGEDTHVTGEDSPAPTALKKSRRRTEARLSLGWLLPSRATSFSPGLAKIL